MIYRAQEDPDFKRSSDCASGNGKGRTTALNVIELANGSIVTPPSGTHN